MEDNLLLAVNNLKVSLKDDNNFVQILRGVDIELKSGEILGILGESGSGKTVTASTILRLEDSEYWKTDCGSIIFHDIDLAKLDESHMREIRGKKISYIFQDAAAALNPYKRIGKQIKEVAKVHGEKFTDEKIINCMKQVGIDNAEIVYNMYSWQLSGGLCQRVVIAMGTLFSPEIIIADEPTTAIDASLQKKVLDLLKHINKNSNSSIIIITHDFDVVKYICSRVIVMYGGLVMEEGETKELLNNPLHPYTKELLKCALSLDDDDENLYFLKGKTPSPKEFKNQCPFYDRCSFSRDECKNNIPEMKTLANRKVRCVLEMAGDIING